MEQNLVGMFIWFINDIVHFDLKLKMAVRVNYMF